MHIDKYEKFFMRVSAAFLALAIGALTASVVFHKAALPKPVERVDPELVRSTAPFDEPGLRKLNNGEYEAVLVASAWLWDGIDEDFVVPAGSTVHFKVTSVDYIHGMLIPETNINAMVIPGQVTEVEATFDEPGTYSLICHEYCGAMHHTMGAQFTVE